MQITARIIRQIALFSMLLIVIPMVVFPELLGTSLTRMSLINIVYELAFYGAMGAMLDRKTTLRNLLQAAGMCLVYRMTLGAVFSFTIAAMYSMSISISLALG
ncbi:MAG: hypothetical protein U9R56_04545, partial [candidate division Zixibacteria bacterium]|nr:hypothetical protein [candidate division Zixibacteria bacterium]